MTIRDDGERGYVIQGVLGTIGDMENRGFRGQWEVMRHMEF